MDRISVGLLFALQLGTIAAWAAPRPIALEEAIQKSLEYSQSYKQALSAVKQAEANYRKANAAIYPTINFTAGGYVQENPLVVSSGTTSSAGTGSTSTNSLSNTSQSYSAGLSLTQPIYVAGALSAGLGLMQANLDIANAQLFQTKETVVFNTATAFLNMSMAQENLFAAKGNSEQLLNYLKITTSYARIGRARRIDRMQADVNFKLSLSDVDLAVVSFKQNLYALKVLLGDESSDVYQSNTDFTKVSPEVFSLEPTFEQAIQNNPSIKIALRQENLIEYNKTIDLSQDLPSLNLVANGGFAAPDTGTFINNPTSSYKIGLQLTIPLFSGFSSFAKKDIYSEESYQSKRNTQLARDAIRQTIETGLDSFSIYKKELQTTSESARDAESALDEAIVSFKKGIVASQDVLNLQTTRYGAEKLVITSRYSYIQSLLNIEQAMGTDLEKYTKSQFK